MKGENGVVGVIGDPPGVLAGIIGTEDVLWEKVTPLYIDLRRELGPKEGNANDDDDGCCGSC